MEFKDFLAIIPKIKSIIENDSYNGIDFHLKLTPKVRLNFDMSKVTNPKEAGVLVLFYPKNGKTHIVLMLRSQYKGTHSAQISFPGGKKEPSDKNLIYTALRESQEEIGINASQIESVFPLTDLYIPPSNFWVYPFIGILKSTPKFKTNYEVEELIEISLDDLLKAKIITKQIKTSYLKSTDMNCFIFNEFTVWGATAMILNEIRELMNYKWVLMNDE